MNPRDFSSPKWRKVVKLGSAAQQLIQSLAAALARS